MKKRAVAAKTTTPDKSETRVSLNKRRMFIARNLRARGMVSLALLNQHLSTASLSSSSLAGDIEFLNELGFAIELVEAGGRRYLVDAQSRHIGAKSERMDLHLEAKHFVAMGACSLLFGLPPSKLSDQEDKAALLRRQRLEKSNPELGMLWDENELRNALHENLGTMAESAANDLWTRLQRLWQESHITIFCDAGTTNERMGTVLRDVFLPTSFSPLRALQVCTNSRTLFNAVADFEVCAKAITTGGLQVGVDGSADALAGGLTEAWLKATEGILSFAVSFIGATAVDSQQGFFLADSFEEKSVKEIVLSHTRSRLRVIVIDRSKFAASEREGYRFSAISPDQVDLIITNAEMPDKLSPERQEQVTGAIARIRNRMGVPVIEADFSNRFDGKLFREILRGKELRTRVPFVQLDRLIQELKLDGSQVDGIPLKYVSRAVELFLDSAMEIFLDKESGNVMQPFKDKMRKNFSELAKRTFLGARDAAVMKSLESSSGE